jgi:hypothetical protein
MTGRTGDIHPYRAGHRIWRLPLHFRTAGDDRQFLRVAIDIREGEPGCRHERSVHLASVRLDWNLSQGVAREWVEQRQAAGQTLIRLGYTTEMEQTEFEARFWDRLMGEARRFRVAATKGTEKVSDQPEGESDADRFALGT